MLNFTPVAWMIFCAVTGIAAWVEVTCTRKKMLIFTPVAAVVVLMTL